MRLEAAYLPIFFLSLVTVPGVFVVVNSAHSPSLSKSGDLDAYSLQASSPFGEVARSYARATRKRRR